MAENQPNVNHLGVGGQREFLHDTDEDGRHDQHVGQLHGKGGLEEERLEEGCGKGDHHEEEGGEISAHQHTQELPSQNNSHPNSFIFFPMVSKFQIPVVYTKKSHICVLFHDKLSGKNPHQKLIKHLHGHVDGASLKEDIVKNRPCCVYTCSSKG